MAMSDDQSKLHLVVYTSVASKSLKVQGLDSLIEDAREFNSSNDITGVLLYADGVFVQAIEGGEQVIRGLYGRILEDERHHAVVTLKNGPLSKRRFSDWSLGFEYSNSSGEEPDDEKMELSPQQLFESKNGIELIKLLDELDISVDPDRWSEAG